MDKELWSFIHNAIAHPVMAVTQMMNVLAEKFHNWTADKID
jgi:hypothetical protein